jgi:cytochrome c oxidase cbb3-type subunit III
MRLALGLVLALSSACNGGAERGGPAPAPSEPAPAMSNANAARREAPLGPDDIYNQRCFVCHGKTGAGDGPGAAVSNPKPRSLADPEWQKSVSDEQIEKVIVGGGNAIGKSTAMPANPDLKNKPELVSGLVKKVRGFAR